MSASPALVWVAPAQKITRGASGRVGAEGAGNGHPAPSTILVVEDEILVRLAVCDYLRDCGYRVLEASSGEEAQVIFRAGEEIEILFSDVNLGGAMSGFGLAQWVRAQYPGIRIILTSGVSRMTQDAADLCDGPLLQKPYSHEELADRIKRLRGALAQTGGGR